MDNLRNIDVVQGSKFEEIIFIRSEGNNELVDLTGITFKGQARYTYKAASVLIEFVFVLPNQTTNKGEVNFTLPHTALNSVVLEKSIMVPYDVKMLLLDGSYKEVCRGLATLHPSATKLV